MKEQRIRVVFEGFDEAVEPQNDAIYFNGITHRFLCDGLDNTFLYAPGETFEYTVYFWHNQYDLKDIRFFDETGAECMPKGLSFEDCDRSYKDLYWYYSRNQNYCRTIRFVVPNYPLTIRIAYARSEDMTVLKTELGSIGKLLYRGEERRRLSYLHSFEETANCSRHYLQGDDIYFYSIRSSVTFAIGLIKKRDLLLKVGETIYEPSLVETIDESGIQSYMYVFGSLDSMDDECISSRKGRPIILDKLEVVAHFFH